MATRMTANDAKVHDYIYKRLNLREVRALVKDNTGWDKKTLDDAEDWYRNYLWLAYRNRRSRQPVGIERHADHFWHAHILDTEDYAKVCQKILGRRGFLHHKPVARKAATSPRLQQQTTLAYAAVQHEFVKPRPHHGFAPFDMPCFWHIVFG
jgi:hypothetical protein